MDDVVLKFNSCGEEMTRLLFQVLVLVAVMPLMGWRMHPYYVSMTEIEFNPKEKKLEISVRIFTDDLEKALARSCGCKTDLLSPEKKESMKPVLDAYLKKKLGINIDGKPVTYSFLGFEKEEESTWSFLEVTLDKTPDQMTVTNQLLYEIQKQQSNLVRYRKPGSDKTLQLTNPEREVRF